MSDSTEFLAVVTKTLVMGWSCYLGNSDCVERAGQLFQEWVEAEDFENRFLLIMFLKKYYHLYYILSKSA